MEGKHFLDIALVIALMVQATKLSDLVFSPNQKKAVQNKVENWTLYLESINPEKYFLLFFQKKFSRILTVVLIFISSATISYIETKFIHAYYNHDHVIGYLTYVLAFFFQSLFAIRFFQMYGYKILEWMLNSNFLGFFKRYSSVFTFVIITYFIHNYLNSDLGSVLEMILVYSGIIIVAYILFFYGFLVICFKIIIKILLVLLIFFKWLLWRIVEYNKGAIEAITLLITVVLGVAEVIIKSK